MEDGGRLTPMAAELLDRIAISVGGINLSLLWHGI
jgi:hypothetical protein